MTSNDPSIFGPNTRSLPVVSEPRQTGQPTTTKELIAWSLEKFTNQKMVITTQFGMEGCALIDMYTQAGAGMYQSMEA